MAREGGESLGPLVAVALIAAIAGSVTFVLGPLRSQRPSEQGEFSSSGSADATVQARLWQDPITAIQTHWNGMVEDWADRTVRFSPLATPPKTISSVANELAKDDGRQLRLFVLVSGSPYAEDIEQRRRQRYAIVSALTANNFKPVDSDRIRYFLAPAFREDSRDGEAALTVRDFFPIGYEHYDDALEVAREFDDPNDGDSGGFPQVREDRPPWKSVVVFWLNAEDFADYPLHQVPALMAAFSKNAASVEAARDDPVTVLLGPWSSDALHRMWETVADHEGTTIAENFLATINGYPNNAEGLLVSQEIQSGEPSDRNRPPPAASDGIDTFRFDLIEEVVAEVDWYLDFGLSPDASRVLNECLSSDPGPGVGALERCLVEEPFASIDDSDPDWMETVATRWGPLLVTHEAVHGPHMASLMFDAHIYLDDGLPQEIDYDDLLTCLVGSNGVEGISSCLNRYVEVNDSDSEWFDWVANTWFEKHPEVNFLEDNQSSADQALISPIDFQRDRLHIISTRSTVPLDWLFRNISYSDKQDATDTTVEDRVGTALGVKLFRSVVAKDDLLLDRVLTELDARGLCESKKLTVAIVSEQDTAYGRLLDDVMEARAREFVPDDLMNQAVKFNNRASETMGDLEEFQSPFEEFQSPFEESQSQFEKSLSQFEKSLSQFKEFQRQLKEFQPQLLVSAPQFLVSLQQLEESRSRFKESQSQLKKSLSQLKEFQPQLKESQSQLARLTTDVSEEQFDGASDIELRIADLREAIWFSVRSMTLLIRAGDQLDAPVLPCAEALEFREFGYLRGVDGELPPRTQSGGGRPTAGNESSASPSSAAWRTLMPGAPLEQAVGPSQLDYIRRLADMIGDSIRNDNDTARGSSDGYVAIGILGSDVYDKLLILQALRDRLPNAVFFTTDLDARLTDPDSYRWTRNLLVSSSYGLSDEVNATGFRDSYQTALYRATSRLLDGEDWNGQWAADPKLFEIGRAGAVDLVNWRENLSSRSFWVALLLLLLPLLALGILATAQTRKIDKKRSAHRYGAWNRVQFYSFVPLALLAALLVFWRGAEPILIDQGISSIPTLILQITTILFAISIVDIALGRTRQGHRDIGSEYGLNAPAQPSWQIKNSLKRIWERRIESRPVGTSVQDAWNDYFRVEHWKSRPVRILIPLTIWTALVVLVLFEPGPLLTNGFYWIASSVRILTVVAVLATVFFCTDTLRIGQLLIRDLARNDLIGWSSEKFPSMSDGLDDYVKRRWRTMDLTVRVTQILAPVVIFPFILTALLVVARNPMFEGWIWTWPLLLFYLGISVWILIRALAFQFEAAGARDTILGDLRRHGHQLASDKLQSDRLELVVNEISRLREGAFVPWTRNPILQSIALPSGGFGLLTLLNAFLS